jgi:hypothetical protein
VLLIERRLVAFVGCLAARLAYLAPDLHHHRVDVAPDLHVATATRRLAPQCDGQAMGSLLYRNDESTTRCRR